MKKQLKEPLKNDGMQQGTSEIDTALRVFQRFPKPKNVSAFLITNPTNIAYLTGFTGSNGFLLVTKNKTILFTDSRYIERAKYSVPKFVTLKDITKLWRNPKELKKEWQKTLKSLRIRSIGFEGSHLTVNQFKKYRRISRAGASGTSRSIKFKDISGEVESLRAIKNPYEISLIKKSQQINMRTFELIKNFIQARAASRTQARIAKHRPLREIDVVWEIKRIAHELGAEDVSFEPIVAFGKNSSMPHHKSGNTILKKNDIILIDMGMKYKGYCSDMTRTILPKKPTKLQKEVYDIVKEAQKNALAKIKTGMTEQKIDSLARKVIEKYGYAENFTHGTGHGVGLEIHESPSLHEKGKQKIKPGMVMTIEPGIYLPGKFGVRIEDITIL